MSDAQPTWLIPTLIALAGAAGLWYYQSQSETPPAPVEMALPAPVADAAPDSSPRYPVPASKPERPAVEALEPLPPLDDSDSYFELAMADNFGSDVDEWLVDEALIEKIVATVDNLPRARVAERIRPFSRLPGSYAVDGQDDSGEFRPNRANYARYDALVNLLAATDQASLVDTYLRFYPLFQEAYVNLGYPDGYFNDRLVEVIDHLLATPELGALPELSRPNVLYEYADPTLEALSGGQKTLLRAGPEHAALIKEFLNALRAEIVGRDPA